MRPDILKPVWDRRLASSARALGRELTPAEREHVPDGKLSPIHVGVFRQLYAIGPGDACAYLTAILQSDGTAEWNQLCTELGYW